VYAFNNRYGSFLVPLAGTGYLARSRPRILSSKMVIHIHTDGVFVIARCVRVASSGLWAKGLLPFL